jgi:hypothetical protein
MMNMLIGFTISMTLLLYYLYVSHNVMFYNLIIHNLF